MTSAKKSGEAPKIVGPPLFGSARLTIGLIGLAGYFCAIFVTINLGIAIVCINKRSQRVSTNFTAADDMLTNNCTSNSSEIAEENATCFDSITKEEELYLAKPAQGMLLGALYYGVVAVQFIAGWVCDKYGTMKLLMISGALLLGTCSLLSPVVLEYAGVPYFFVLRIIKGIGMGVLLTPVLPLQNRWSTPLDQGLLISLSTSGIGIANAVTYPISGLLCQYVGWRFIFYFNGIICVVWAFFALFLLYDSPVTHPRINAKEKQYLVTHSKTQQVQTKKVIPWKKMLLSIPVWSVIITNFLFFAATKGTVINLPIFIKDVLGFSVTEIGIFSAMPLITSLVVHIIVGPIFDRVRVMNFFSITFLRKSFTLFGSIIPAALMFAVSQIPPDQKYLVIILIAVGYGLSEVAWMGGFYFGMMDMAPDFVGILQGINRTIGLAPGFIIPMVISTLTPNGTHDEWSHVFLIFGGLYAFAGLLYLVTGNSEIRSWGKVTKDPKSNPLL